MILLPTKDDHIDFEFMENFIAELEARSIAELEAYLTVTGLKDYTLSEEEANALCGIKTVQYKGYKIGQLFDEEPVKHKLSKEDLSDGYRYPAYSSESSNGGKIGFANVAEFICDDNTPFYITFGDHTRVFNIAKKSFSVLDNVKVLKPRINHEKALLFIIATWAKQIPNIGYARHWKVAKRCVLPLPTINGQIDLEFMERFISAIQKLVIRNAVLFAEKKIGTTNHIICTDK